MARGAADAEYPPNRRSAGRPVHKTRDLGYLKEELADLLHGNAVTALSWRTTGRPTIDTLFLIVRRMRALCSTTSIPRSPVTCRLTRARRAEKGGEPDVTTDELVVAFALTRLDHPALDLEEVASLLVRRMGGEQVVQLATESLAFRDELRGDAFAAAVEHVLRTVLLLRDGADD